GAEDNRRKIKKLEAIFYANSAGSGWHVFPDFIVSQIARLRSRIAVQEGDREAAEMAVTEMEVLFQTNHWGITTGVHGDPQARLHIIYADVLEAAAPLSQDGKYASQAVSIRT